MFIKLKSKIWLTVFIIVLIFSFFTLFYFPNQQSKNYLTIYNREAENLAKTVALGVKIAMDEEYFQGEKEALDFALEDKRLKFVSLLNSDADSSGKLIISTTIPEKADPDTLHYPRGSIITKLAPFKVGKMSGAVLVVFSTDEINKSIKKVKEASLVVSTIVFCISMLIGFWLSRNISVPVMALRDAAKKVGEGDLTQCVYNNSSDEIGELSIAFNKMVDDLGNADRKLKTANAGLESLNKKLGETVEDLRETQDQLIQAEKMASLGQLTAGIAHEINNPINFVSANIQPLKDDMADILNLVSNYEKVIGEKKLEGEFEEVKRVKENMKIDLAINEINVLLKGMEEGAHRTSEIVKGLRNFSHMDQNIFIKTNLNESLESTLTLLHSAYKNRIEIIKEYGSIPDVDCFPGQINQVFMNILSNAIQAIPKEGSIFIKTWKAEETVKVSIRDSGVGITEEIRKKIFDPFFTTKDVGKGTGLGLSISYGIIEKHKGDIKVISQPGQGTDFIVTIPVNQPK